MDPPVDPPAAMTATVTTTTQGHRLAPLPFSVGAAVVYLLSFGSQVLLAPPTTDRLSVVPFALGQFVLIAAWIVLHVRRLRDAGRPPGLVYGIAALYAVEMVLLVIAVGLILASAGASNSAGPDSGILNLFVILYLLTMLSGDPSGGIVQVWILGFVVLMLLPVVVASVFSVWAATRPRATPAP